MSKRRLIEDRAMRDTALEIFRADLTQIKSDLQTKSVGGRVAERLGEGARDVAEDAASAAEANYGKIAALGAGIALWTFRNPLLNFVSKYLDNPEPTDELEVAEDYPAEQLPPEEVTSHD